MSDDQDDQSIARPDDVVARARYPIQLNLPEPVESLLEDARQAVLREYCDSVRWKKLKCRRVEVVAESDGGSVYELSVGSSVDFDWSWEGSVAFRPLNLRDFESSHDPMYDGAYDVKANHDSVLWSGEVLEVDEASGRIFVVTSDPEARPRRGSFYVRPFEFLACLNSVFNEPAFRRIRELLPGRLAATSGDVHPDVVDAHSMGLPELQHCWEKSWSVVWGPPGTGKTFITGQQVARVLADQSERILVVSTTNRASDASAIAIGKGAEVHAPDTLSAGKLLRIGKGGSLRSFKRSGLMDMLRGTETEYLARIDRLYGKLPVVETAAERALLRKRIRELRDEMQDASYGNFIDEQVRVIVSTAFRATSFLGSDTLKMDLQRGVAPFTTVIVDEAGLISRAATAALSLLASRRVMLVGDSKQLAPISRISRILPPAQGDWLASSGLSHLNDVRVDGGGVHVLREQRRMHSDVCDVVSHYQYDGFLTTAAPVASRQVDLPDVLAGEPRAIWYVLDEDVDDLPALRAERGPGNRSWIRTVTPAILDKLLADPQMRSARGLFMSPFRAQAQAIASYFGKNALRSWSASTVHSQQGSEADIVVFDTVNAGSYNWPYDEWKRLVNVAISRAREVAIILASRAEMEEPYLRPLLRHLAPRILQRQGRRVCWKPVPVRSRFSVPKDAASETAPEATSNTLGSQLARRCELRPVLSHEQQRLCLLELDGKPRLVRGVAGSGKTLVLSHWVMQTVQRIRSAKNVRIWAVFANRSLQSLIGDSIETTWERENGPAPFPWEHVSLFHIRDLLGVLLPEVKLNVKEFGYDYDAAAAAYLERMPAANIAPRCDALFIDEAQDLGPNTLKLLSALVRQADTTDANSRAVNIFYDNAQNIYGRATPRWTEFGLDLRGRSTVMKESFRSTKPILEFAINVLYRMVPPDNNPDHRELVRRGLVERVRKGNSEWWNIRYNQIDGPAPEFREFETIESEFDAVGSYCRDLIRRQQVQPSDICVIYLGQAVRQRLETQVAPVLRDLGVELSVQTGQPFSRHVNMVLATTPHSFKGYDAEVVIIPAVDQFAVSDVGILANSLYVAMTRARSVLTLFGHGAPHGRSHEITSILRQCLATMQQPLDVESTQDDLSDLLEVIGIENRQWLLDVWNGRQVSQEPIFAPDGQIVAEPLFWYRAGTHIHACFGTDVPSAHALHKLEARRIQPLRVGEELPPADE